MVVDPEGNPIGGTMAAGIGDVYWYGEYLQESSTIEVRALDPSRPRRVTITHAARKLVGSVYLKGDETGPLTLRLQPWGTITGRIVDDDGKPRGPGARQHRRRFPKRPDRAGLPARWQHRMAACGRSGNRLGLTAGSASKAPFPASCTGHRSTSRFWEISELFQDVTVAPGEVKDLGDLKVVPHRENRS